MLHKLTVDCALLSNQYYIIHWVGGTLTNDHVLRRNKTKKSIDLVVMLDYCNTKWAVRECNQMGIPVVAICDSDCDPSKVQYPIPANDDNLACVSLIAQTLATAAKEGYELRKR
jgi:small subunit ribosomal protein S2